VLTAGHCGYDGWHEAHTGSFHVELCVGKQSLGRLSWRSENNIKFNRKAVDWTELVCCCLLC
jgi:hypothetical protein